MNKTNENFYDKLIKKRVPIMVFIIFILLPLLFCIGYLTNTYKDNKPTPFADYEYTKTSISDLNKNKFEIEEFYLSKFALFEEGEIYDDGQIYLTMTVGERIDTSIPKSANIYLEMYVCYNWSNITSSKSSSTLYLDYSTGNYSKETQIKNFDATFDTNPFFFKSVNLQKDIRILTMLSWNEKQDDGTEEKVYYLVESSYSDLYISGTTELTKD